MKVQAPNLEDFKLCNTEINGKTIETIIQNTLSLKLVVLLSVRLESGSWESILKSFCYRVVIPKMMLFGVTRPDGVVLGDACFDPHMESLSAEPGSRASE